MFGCTGCTWIVHHHPSFSPMAWTQCRNNTERILTERASPLKIRHRSTHRSDYADREEPRFPHLDDRKQPPAPRPGLQAQHIPPSVAGAMHLGWCTACETSRRSDIALIYTRITHPDRYAPRCYYARDAPGSRKVWGWLSRARRTFASYKLHIFTRHIYLSEIELYTSYIKLIINH